MTTRPQVGYAKLGRSMQLDLTKCGSLGGDNEMIPTVKLLAERHPEVDFVLIGRNSGDHPRDVGLPSNVSNPWTDWAPEFRKSLNHRNLAYPNLSIEDHIKVRDLLMEITGDTFRDLDGMVMWLGQHGTSNSPLPSIKDRTKLTKPYDWATLYASYLLHGMNMWRDQNPVRNEEVLLNADPRNYPKYRDTKWPLRQSVLGQYTQLNTMKHERFGDDNAGFPWFPWFSRGAVWEYDIQTVYSRLEISSLIPGTPYGDTIEFDENYRNRESFGVILNETRYDVSLPRARRTALRDWILPLQPSFIHGHWSAKTQEALRLDIDPVPVLEFIKKMQTVKSTITTPASGSGWATAKPWEMFAAGVVCFFHPLYDDQDNILSDAPQALRDFLRPKTVKELQRRVDLVHNDYGTWSWAVNAQRIHFDRAVSEMTYLHTIEQRLGLV